MGDDRSLQHEDARDRNILSPDNIRELDVGDEQLLFDGLLPDLVQNSGPQGEDPFTLTHLRINCLVQNPRPLLHAFLLSLPHLIRPRVPIHNGQSITRDQKPIRPTNQLLHLSLRMKVPSMPAQEHPANVLKP